MKFKVGYKELVEAFALTRVATSSKKIKEEAKNAIFQITDEGEVRLCAFTQSAQIRVSLEAEDVEGSGFFQIRASRLNDVLAPFTSLSRTEVTEVEFAVQERNIVLRVHEEEPGEEATGEFDQISRYSFGKTEVPSKVVDSFNKEVSEDYDDIPAGSLDILFKDLMPLLANDTSANMSSYLNITNEFIFLALTKQVSGYKNFLGTDKLDGGSLDYAQIATIVQLGALADDSVRVSVVSERTRSFSIDGVDYFVNPKSASNVSYKDSYDPVFGEGAEALEHGITVDRGYLKDVLSRFEYDKTDQPTFTITENGLKISTQAIEETTVPLTTKVGEVVNLAFKIDSTFLKKMIVGDDSLYGDIPLGIYFRKNGTGLKLYITDDKKAWLSTTTVAGGKSS